MRWWQALRYSPYRFWIDIPPPVRTRKSMIFMEGWCVLPGDPAPPELRVRLKHARGEDLITWMEQVARPDVAEAFRGRAVPVSGGFRFAVHLQNGRNSIELELWDRRKWRRIARRIVWRSRPPSRAALLLPGAPDWPPGDPLVSVIVGNGEEAAIARSQESVRRQTLSDWELLRSDDSASGGSPGESVRGKYVCWLRAGEEIAPAYLEKSLFAMESGAPACGARSGDHPLDLRPVEGNSVRGAAPVFPAEIACFTAVAPPVTNGNAGPARNLLRIRTKPDPAIPVLISLPFLTVGGAEMMLSRVSAALGSRGFRFLLITTQPQPPGAGDTTCHFDTKEIFALPEFLPEEFWPAFLAYLVKSRGIRIVLLAGGSYVYGQLPALRQIAPRPKFVSLLFNQVGHTPDFLANQHLVDMAITEHEGMRTWLLERGVRDDRVTMIPNGVDLRRFAPRDQLARRRFVAGFFGRFSQEKGPDLFLEIAGRFQNRDDIEFVMAGGGPMESVLRERVRRQPGARVRFLGFVDAAGSIPDCDVIVVCSRLDGRPNIVLEAMACGIPVIASRVGGIPAVIKDGVTGILCDPGGIDAFVAAVERLAGDRHALAEMGRCARAYAEEHLSLEVAAGRFAELFQLLAKSS